MIDPMKDEKPFIIRSYRPSDRAASAFLFRRCALQMQRRVANCGRLLADLSRGRRLLLRRGGRLLDHFRDLLDGGSRSSASPRLLLGGARDPGHRARRSGRQIENFLQDLLGAGRQPDAF